MAVGNSPNFEILEVSNHLTTYIMTNSTVSQVKPERGLRASGTAAETPRSYYTGKTGH
jgi:hypothetical protein